MKLRQAENTTLIIGETTQKEFKINLSNLKHITHLLINQYSNVRESVCRELISNMYDSGGKEVTCIVGNHGDYVYFQDINGPGMSKEFMLNTYPIIGESTKRDSDDLIGAFGVGRLSSLAYTNMYRIISTHQGIKCEYVVYIDDGIIKINLTKEEETKELSGTRVEIQMKNDLDYWESAVKEQYYFPNLKIHFNGKLEETSFIENALFIKKEDCDSNDFLHICFGKVKYDIDWSQIDNKYFFLKTILFGLKFNLDSGLIPTPSRENITYDKEGKHIIEQKLDEVIAYLKIKCVRQYSTRELHLFETNNFVVVEIDGLNISVDRTLIKNLEIYNEIINQFKGTHLFPISKFSPNHVIVKHASNPTHSYLNYDQFNIFLEQDQVLPKKYKDFLKESADTIIKNQRGYAVWKFESDKFLSSYFDCDVEKLIEIKDIFLEYFSDNKILKWGTCLQEAFEDWKLQNKKIHKKKVSELGEITLQYLREPLSSSSHKNYVLEQRSFNLKYLITKYRFIVYTLNDFPENYFPSINSINRNGKEILICKLNTQTLSYLMENIKHKLISIDDVQQKNALLKSLYTKIIAKKCYLIVPNSVRAWDILHKINPNLHNAVEELQNIVRGFNLPSQEVQDAIIFAAETLGCINRKVWDQVQFIEKYKGCFDVLFHITESRYLYYTDEQVKLIKEFYYLKLLHKGFYHNEPVLDELEQEIEQPESKSLIEQELCN